MAKLHNVSTYDLDRDTSRRLYEFKESDNEFVEYVASLVLEVLTEIDEITVKLSATEWLKTMIEYKVKNTGDKFDIEKCRVSWYAKAEELEADSKTCW